MVFKDRFDAGAATYTSPDVVRRWYAQSGYVATGVRSDVAQLFSQSSVSASNSSTLSGSLTNGTLNNGFSTSGAKDSGKLNTGAIVGGIVGGVVVLAALAAGI